MSGGYDLCANVIETDPSFTNRSVLLGGNNWKTAHSTATPGPYS